MHGPHDCAVGHGEGLEANTIILAIEGLYI